MKTLSLMVLLATVCVIAVADDVKPPVMPKKNKIVFEYSYPPPATQKPPTSAETAPIPRTGSKEWLQRVDQRDRKLMAPWEWQRLSSWREAYSFAELPPSVNGFTSR